MNKEKSVTTLSVENFHDTYRVKITVNKVVHFLYGTKFKWLATKVRTNEIRIITEIQTFGFCRSIVWKIHFILLLTKYHLQRHSQTNAG